MEKLLYTKWPQFSGNSATEILRQRYARGELSQAEYEQMRRELGD